MTTEIKEQAGHERNSHDERDATFAASYSSAQSLPDEVAAVVHHGARSGQPPVLVAQLPQTRPISIPTNPADDPSYFVADAALT